MLRCTSTLSMTTWKNSGETSANSCRKNEATSTSPSRRRYLWIAPRNQVMSKRRDEIGRARRAGSSARAGRPRPPRTRRASSAAGAATSGAWTRTLSSPALPSSRKPPSRSAAIAGQRRAWRAAPSSVCDRARLEPELLGAAQHLGHADGVRAQLMADLVRIDADAVKAQQRHEGGKPLWSEFPWSDLYPRVPANELRIR